MRHVNVDMSTVSKISGGLFGGLRDILSGVRASSLAGDISSRADGARMLLAATKARLISPDPASALDEWAERQGEEAYRNLDRRSSQDGSNYLLRGAPVDLFEASLERWNPERYPTLYQPIPADLRNPIHWDGKVLGGVEVPATARRHISPEVYITAVSMASKNAAVLCKWLRRGLLTIGIGVALAMGAVAVTAGAGYPRWAADAGYAGPVTGWYLAIIVDCLIQSAIAGGLAIMASRLAFQPFRLFTTNRILDRYFDRVQAPLLFPCRDAQLIHGHRADQRDEEYMAYARQVEAVNDPKRPLTRVLFRVGTAQGTLRSRGVMRAPARGTPMCIDGESIRQHVLVLGGTGSGKTRLVIRPLASQIMTADWGQDTRIGAYVTDGKGTLWRDLIFAEGMADRTDVRVVGSGTYVVQRPDGTSATIPTFGCNLIAGMTPMEVGDIFESICSQLGSGDGKDKFWVRSAAIAMMHGANLARFIEQSSDSTELDYWEDTVGVSPFTLIGIAKLIFDSATKGGLLDRAMSFVDRNASNDLTASRSIAESVAWVNNAWKPMASETKTGVIANLDTVIGKLIGSPMLASAFCQRTLAADQVVDVDHALDGGVLMIAVGEDEFGVAGKIITCCLKTRFYIKAKRRLQAEGRAARERISVAMIADEFQLLATTGAESDETFWNTARETGVFAVVATQSIAAMEARIGAPATNNLLDLFRSKIVLATEERATQEYCQRLAGKVYQGWKTEADYFETVHQREKAYPDVGYDRLETSMLDGLLPARLSLSIRNIKDVIAHDDRFVGQYTKSKDGDDNARIGAMREAWNRYIDKNQKELTNGLKEVPALNESELNRGSGFGFVYLQRAGGVRLDVVDFRRD